jgi:hypothetical protein
MGAILQRCPAQCGAKILSQKCRRQRLIAAWTETQPNKMPVIWHQHVTGTGNGISSARMEQNFAKVVVKNIIQPTSRAIFECVRPKDHRVSLVEFASETWQLGFEDDCHTNDPAPPGVGYKPNVNPNPE